MTGHDDNPRPRLRKVRVGLIGPDTSVLQRIITRQCYSDTLGRSLQVQGVGGGGAEWSEALQLEDPSTGTTMLDSEIDAAHLLESPDQNRAAFSRPACLHRTVLNNALQWSSLEAGPAAREGYCETFDSVTACLTKVDADACAHDLDCLRQPLEVRRSFSEKILESVNEIP